MSHITTIVFDMGGVLMDWDPVRIARAFAATEEDALLLKQAVFDSVEWAYIDAGALDLDTLVWMSSKRVPDYLVDAAERLCRSWHEAFYPIDETGELVHALHAAGYAIYLLSNAGAQFDLYRDRIPAIDLFSGEVVSFRERVVKPGSEIFCRLLARFGLRAQECLFVDDVAANVEAAKRVGLAGHVFGGGSVAELTHLLIPADTTR